MLPQKSDLRWVAILNGTNNHKFSNAAASMLLFRLRNKTKENPSSITANLDEMYVFFTKYEKMIQEDIKAIFK